ncbi:protease inhibitor Inh/omp19 family protein [Pseudomonas sp. MM213]|uniref:AprI/Inh family metalloprotease inhibitor n=1 Tax=Pseudomonas sp. MM213 TaxID=2866807 RepID=UPI001CF30A2F|nr:AprI/Inh family metalloprotease inhibitor [Pseudomonas sp. MM213]UCP11128.1 protease inhibitor Inh/omp19 family protein [Pseudomonas sp. MM213]
MICNAFTCKTNVWLLAALMMFFGDVAMASSLKLADPSELAGKWRVTQQDKPSIVCPLEFKANQTLGDGTECLVEWLEEQPIGWFPEPDGIALTGKEGSKIVFFSRQRDGLYRGTSKSGLIIILEHPLD